MGPMGWCVSLTGLQGCHHIARGLQAFFLGPAGKRVTWPPCMQVEISLQPWRAFQPDGVILFSDILTPLTGMNIPFDISSGKGPIIHDPIRTMEVS